MKPYRFLYILFLLLLCWGCLKTNPTTTTSSSFTIVNGINGNSGILTDFEPVDQKGNYQSSLPSIAAANQIWYGSSSESGSYSGPVSLSIYSVTDTTATLWKGSFSFQPGSINSLFLSGDTSSVDTLLSADQIPYHPVSDSMAGLRIVNLVWGSTPISINIAGNLPTQTEFTNVGYRQITGFKPYIANSSATGSYSFEIRDQASDSLLATYQWSYTLYKNNTLVLIGSENQRLPQAVQVLTINNF